MTTNDLIRFIPFEAPSAWVPTAHMPPAIEHVNGVIRNALNQQPELCFAFAQFGLGGPSLSQVASDLGEADKLALRRADRVYDNMGPELRAVLTHAPALALEAAGTLCLC